MTTPSLGTLVEVPVRDIWKHEQYDLSDWLTKEEHITLLNDVLHLNLVDIDKEVYVGSYRCDLVATDETTGRKIIIENQLEPSNHDHLGKIITYASGLDAKDVVWIVTEAREEHSSAIEWLNNNTATGINFFLLELHAYKIGSSLPAPYFKVIEQPNDFIKSSITKAGSEAWNESQSKRFEFWSKFNEVLVSRGKPFNVRKPTTDHWYSIAVGRSDACVSINLVNRNNSIVVEFDISENKRLFDDLFENKTEIETELAFDSSLEWARLDGKKASRIKYSFLGLDFDKQDNYPELMNKAIDVAVKMKDVFKKYL